jgi:sugar phosphate permease
LFFKEPEGQDQGEPARERKTFAKVFSDMLLVFGNLRFMAFLLLFGGFWLMFWQTFYLLPFYTVEVLHFEKFELLETVDAFCIIFFTVPMAAVVKNWKPITAMVAGLIVSTCCWFVIGSFGSVTATILGIALFALGEATQTPRFYEYVSNLAPRNQVGTFMGFAFLPVALGSFGAGPVSDWLRTSYLKTDPALMWYIVGGIGIATTLLMLTYNAFVTEPAKSIDL